MATYEVLYSFRLEFFFFNSRMIFLSALILMFNLILYSRLDGEIF